MHKKQCRQLLLFTLFFLLGTVITASAGNFKIIIITAVAVYSLAINAPAFDTKTDINQKRTVKTISSYKNI